jgi:hypothetical protein
MHTEFWCGNLLENVHIDDLKRDRILREYVVMIGGDETGLGSGTVVCFDTSDVERAGSATAVLVSKI